MKRWTSSTWDGGRRIRAEVVKRKGIWISVVRGSDGWPVLYNDVGGRDGWVQMMRSSAEDLRTVYRVEQAGHRLPEYKHLTHY